MRLSILGVWGLQTVGETPSFLLTESGQSILVDAGPGTTRQLARLGITLPQIDTLFISHVHADHLLGAPYAIFARTVQARSYDGEVNPLRVVASADVHEALEEILRRCYPTRDFPYERHVVDEEESAPVRVKKAQFSTRFADHTVPTLSLRVDFDSGRSIGYTADTLLYDGLDSFMTGVDVLIAEAFGTRADFGAAQQKLKHSLAGDAGVLAKSVNPEFLVLYHMHERYFADPKRQEVIDEVRSEYSGRVVFPIDLQSLDL